MPPIFELFTMLSLKKDIFIVAALIFGLLVMVSKNIEYYRYYLKSKGLSYEKISKKRFKKFLYISLLLAVPTIVVWMYAIVSTNTLYKEVKNNNITTETLFSSYHVAEINETNEFESTATYDKDGNKKSESPAVLYEVVLIKDKKNKNAGLKGSVVINVTKVNKNSFDVLITYDQVVTIKKEDAEQIFNTLNKIKAKESEN